MSKQNLTPKTTPFPDQDALVEVKFADLPIEANNLANLRLWRAPTWEEMFLAIYNVIDNIQGGMFTSGSVTVPIPDRNSGGRCFLYAGTTWALISMLLDRVPTGVIAGGVEIQSEEDENCQIVLPKNPQEPQPFSGGYHAWAIFEHEGDDFGVDMAYFWFKQHSPVIGPNHFFVARRASLDQLGIRYFPNANLTHAFGLGEDTKAYAPLLRPVCDYLRQMIGKPPLRWRVRRWRTAAHAWFDTRRPALDAQ